MPAGNTSNMSTPSAPVSLVPKLPLSSANGKRRAISWLIVDLLDIHCGISMHCIRTIFYETLLQYFLPYCSNCPTQAALSFLPRIMVHFHDCMREGYTCVYIYINKYLPSWELTYPFPKACLKMIFLSPRWDMLVPWRVYAYVIIVHDLDFMWKMMHFYKYTHSRWLSYNRL